MVSEPPAAQALTDGVDVQHFELAAGRWTESDFGYQFTRTVTGTINGGSAITEIAAKTSFTPAGSVSLGQTYKFGSASVQCSRGIGQLGYPYGFD